MFLLHTKLPVFIQLMKDAALKHGKNVSVDVMGLESLRSAKMQSARTGRLQGEIEQLSQEEGVDRIEIEIIPRVPETMHTAVIRAYDKDGKPTKAILDTIGIIHPATDCYLEGFTPDMIDDRRPPVGKH